MSGIALLFRALLARVRGSQRDGDMDAEMRFHLDMEADELARMKGLSGEEARRRAALAFGGVDKYKEQVRSQRVSHRIEQTAADLRYAARSLRKHPTYTLATIATLALGIAGAAAVFTVLDAVVLRPLPYADSERLVRLQSPVPLVSAEHPWQLAKGEYQYFLRQTRSFETLGLYALGSATVIAGSGADRRAERGGSAVVSASMFDVLKLKPMLGRAITPQDNLSEIPQVVLLSNDYWKRQFAGDSSVIGSRISINGFSAQIVGVMGRNARLPDELASPDALRADVWLPLFVDPAEPAHNHHVFRALGRLKRGVSIASADAELKRLIPRLPEALSTAYSAGFLRSTGFTAQVSSLQADVVGSIARVLWILFASVAMVLLIAAANVANLFVARVDARRKEIGIRSALGADGSRVLLHFLAEGFLIAASAGAAALALTYGAIRLLVTLSPAGVPRLGEVHIGLSTIAFTVVLCAAASVLLAALAMPRRHSALDALQEAGRATTASRRQRAFRAGLMVTQIALSLVVLASAALLFQSFRRLTSVDPGVNPRGVVAFDVSLPFTSYRSFEESRAFFENLETQLRALPGVRAIGGTEAFPLTGNDGCSGIHVADPEPGGETGLCVPLTFTTPGYFSALGIRVRGRALEWSDAKPGSTVVVVSQAIAHRLWGNKDPIGRRFGGGKDTQGATFTVVGVASDVLGIGLDKAPIESIYFPMTSSMTNNLGVPRHMTYALSVQTARPAELMPAVRRILAGIDPDVPPSHIVTMTDVITKSTARTSFSTLLLGLASLIALMLCAVGIYGITSYLVMQRSAEIGIRMALGAGQLEVGRLVLVHSVKLAAIGVSIGLLGAVFATRLLGSQLFQVSPTDPMTLGAASLSLIVLAVLSTYAPARRAMRVDPVRLLHD